MNLTEHTTKHQRTCVGCSKKSEPEEMVRLVIGPDASVAVDAAGSAFGRGAHVHPMSECIEGACKGGLSRAFKQNITIKADALGAAIRDAYERRAIGMMLGARRAGHLAVGADATQSAVNGGAHLVVIASDAGSIAARFEREVATGHATSFGTKASLGELFGTSETAVFAVCHDGVARALEHVLRLARSGR